MLYHQAEPEPVKQCQCIKKKTRLVQPGGGGVGGLLTMKK